MKKIILFICIVFMCFSCKQKSKLNTPLMGWSSWNTYHIDINDSLIMKQAKAMIDNGLHNVGYEYINIDDGFFGLRDSNGVMQPNPIRFPNGLKHVAKYIHSLGLKAGIYSDAGPSSCGARWSGDTLYGPTAGLYGHDEQDANLYFNDWDFDYIKLDYCGAGQELNLDEKDRYTQIHNVISAVAKKPIRLNICRWAFPGTWAEYLADSWRISGDITPNWNSIKTIIWKNMYLSGYARNGKYNDMDMLEIGRGLPENEEQVHFGMWCIMSSPLLIGCDLTKIPSRSLDLLKNKELIALNQDPLGKQAKVVYRQNGGYVFAKDILKNNFDSRAVAFYNPSDDSCSISMPISTIEYGKISKIRDVINHKDEVACGDTMDVNLPPRSVKIYTIQGERIEPSLYEAEWAYCPCYNDLGKDKKGVRFEYDPKASGGVAIDNIGGTSLNKIIWDDVYSQEGGDYTLTVSYKPKKMSKLELMVNLDNPVYLPITTKGDDYQTVSTKIHLNKGYNVIKLGSPYSWCPVIDCIKVQKK